MDIEQMRIRMGEMASEIDRLNAEREQWIAQVESIGDKLANAEIAIQSFTEQNPAYRVDYQYDEGHEDPELGGSLVLHQLDGKDYPVGTLLYAQAFPAQQSCAECGDDDPGLEMYCVKCIDAMQKLPDYAALRKWYVSLTNSDNVQDGINVNGKHCNDAMLDDLERILEQQSPAVAVPECEFNDETDNHHSALAIDENAAFEEELEYRKSDEYKNHELRDTQSSPRITEQDAYDIILSFYWFMENFKSKNGRNPSVIEWNEAEGRALLNKLNAKNNIPN